MSKVFGKMDDGRECHLYEISNSKGTKLVMTDYGATVVSVFAKDREGQLRDVILGYDDLEGYTHGWCYFGGTVGRNANRISGASFTIDGKEYHMDDFDHGNNLHSGINGTSRVLWTMTRETANSLTFHYDDPDLNQGIPGNASIDVTFTVTEDNDFAIHYEAVADQKSIFNMTNHCYFNLAGHNSGSALDQVLQINASAYTPMIDQHSIPTGEILPVEGTPFDFRQAKALGQDIGADHPQLQYASGYDHNFCLDRNEGDGVIKAAEAYAPASGICMELYTNMPGMQLYSSNFLGDHPGKGGVKYTPRDAFCFEAQNYPNAVNVPAFPSPVYEAGQKYVQDTYYHFSIR